MLYLILSGFRTTGQLGSNPNGLPHPWVWNKLRLDPHLRRVLAGGPEQRDHRGGATALAVVLGSMAAFALSRYVFRGRDGLFRLLTAGLLFPLDTAALPLFLLLQKIGMNDNLFGVALPEAAFSLPVTIVILRPFMRAIPAELEDAATVDGASRIRFFVRILLPLSRPALITVGILAFVTSWNTLPAAAHRAQHPLALHAAARGSHVPVAVQHGHRESLRLYRGVHASRPVHFRVRAALPRRRTGRRDQG